MSNYNNAANLEAWQDEYVRPRNDFESSLAAIWRRILRAERVGITDDFFELGGDSLAALSLVHEIECELDIDIDLGGIFAAPTIMRLVELINANSTFAKSVVVPLQDNGDGIPIFCLLGINIYQALADELGENQPVFGVYVPEEEALFQEISLGENPELSINRFSEAYCNAIQAWKPNGPYRLAGFSFGGILAVETASKLQERGEEVDLVFLLDSPLTKLSKRNWLRSVREKLNDTCSQHFSTILGRLTRKSESGSNTVQMPRIENNDARERVAAMQQYFHRKILNDYLGPREGLNGRFVLIRTSSEKQGRSLAGLRDYGWGQFLESKLRVHQVSGEHATMLCPPNVPSVADTMRGYLS